MLCTKKVIRYLSNALKWLNIICVSSGSCYLFDTRSGIFKDNVDKVVHQEVETPNYCNKILYISMLCITFKKFKNVIYYKP